MAEGIVKRGNRFQAWAWDANAKKKVYRTFERAKDAKAWRRDMTRAIERGVVKAGSKKTLRTSVDEWLAGAESGAIRKKGGKRYKRATVDSYRESLWSIWTLPDTGAKVGVIHDYGAVPIGKIKHQDLQGLVRRLQRAEPKKGDDPDARLAGATIQNTIHALSTVLEHERYSGEIEINPAAGLRLPAADGVRERIPSPEESMRYLTIFRESDQPVWAAAIYAALRAGELQALRWEDVDLDKRWLRVERAYNPKSKEYGSPKWDSRRGLPIQKPLVQILAKHALETGTREGLVFSEDGVKPFDTRSLYRRRDTDLKRAAARSVDPVPEPFSLHECRHGYASLMIAAGVNAKALQTFMGHKSITQTFDRYGHLFPGAAEDARTLADGYLDRCGAERGAEWGSAEENPPISSGNAD
jgi:integrase